MKSMFTVKRLTHALLSVSLLAAIVCWFSVFKPSQDVITKDKGVHNKVPGSDNKVPSGDNKVPGGDNKVPGGDNKVPSGDNKVTGGDNKVPGSDKKVHGGDKKVSDGYNKVPDGDNKLPGGDNEVLGVDKKVLGDGSTWIINTDTESNNSSTQVKLILLGYMRGGTTFSSALVNSHPDVFFVYEPLWFFLDPDMIGAAITDQSLPIRKHIKEEWRKQPSIPEPLSFIRALLSCQVTVATHRFIKYDVYSKDLQALNACRRKKIGQDKSSCFLETTRRCRTRPVTSVKTVRLSVAESGRIMEADPLVKVIFIARDPRGNFNSQIETNKEQGSVRTAIGGDYCILTERCRIMREDTRALLELGHKRFQDRILTVRYEDIADDPVGMTTKMLKFVNLKMRPEMMATIQKMTHNPNAKNVPYTVIRNNSSVTASKWREQLDFKIARDTQEKCAPVFQLMNYHIFENEEDMRNMTLPFRDSTFGEEEGIATLS